MIGFWKEYHGKWYKEMYCPSHPNSNEKGTIPVHRFLAAKVLGRKLPDGVEIHHLNGTFDGPLVICQDHAYHHLLHLRQKAFDATVDPKKRRCSRCKQYDDVSNMVMSDKRWQGSYEHRACKNLANIAYRQKKAA